MGSDSLFGVEPPKDADGKVIPLDTEVLCSQSGKVFEVGGFRYSLKVKEWFAYGRYRGAERSGCGETESFLLTPPDSWEKLIGDLRNSAERSMVTCAYFNPAGKDCDECQSAGAKNCTSSAFSDIADRIEKLAGVEERGGRMDD